MFVSTNPNLVPGESPLEFEKAYLARHLQAQTASIVTHSQVDLDAAFSVALWAHILGKSVNEFQVEFDGRGFRSDDPRLGLDINGGVKGRSSSAFEVLCSCLPESDQIALANLKNYITAEDQAKFTLLDESLSTGLLRRRLEDRQLLGASDLELCKLAENELNLILQSHQGRELAKSIADSAVEYGNGRIALVHSSSNLVNQILFKRGFDFVVFEEQTNVGVRRSPRLEEPNLMPLKLEDRRMHSFYADRKGFLLCSGTRKMPARTNPEINAFEIAELLEGFLQRANS
jgi:hypothetical protein